jgi:hypothetical protein
MQPMPPTGAPQLSSPSSGDICKPLDVVGHLLLVRPVEFLPDFPTSNGNRDAVRIDICDLSANDERGQWGAVYRDALWFGRVLVSGLRRQIGDLVLGRMSQGVAKPGQNPPFNLVDMMPDPQAVSAAQQWLSQHPEFSNGNAQSSTSASAPPAPVASAPPAPYPPQQQPQYPAGQPYGVQPQGQYPAGQPYAPAPVPQPTQYPVAGGYQQAAPAYGPQASAQPAAAPTSAGPLTPGVQPGADPFSMLSAEQKAALAAMGFPTP